jgi:hypothetical protein
VPLLLVFTLTAPIPVPARLPRALQLMAQRTRLAPFPEVLFN